MRFYSHKDNLSRYLILGTIFLLFFLLGFLYIEVSLSNKFYISLVTTLIVNGFLYDLWIRTYYDIKDDVLFFRTGILYGKADINKIVSITKNKRLWSGFRPALSKQGFVLRYNKFSEVYISPLKMDEFIELLISKNESIEVKDDAI